jgi:hypothetical protein
MPQENSSLFSKNAKQLLRELFPYSGEFQFNAEIIHSFSKEINGQMQEMTPSKGEVYLAVESKLHQHYYILAIGISHVYTDVTQVYEWGIRPVHHYYGLRQALHIGLFLQPQIKPNLLLCDDVLTTLTFLHSGIPAILVDPKVIWKDPYFQNIIQPTFSNLIVSFPVEHSRKLSLRKGGFRFFDLKSFLGAKHCSSLSSYIHRYKDDNDFLAPLWDLFSYLDDDRLIVEEQLTNFTISNHQ